jgi:uncharacterized protein YecA (UPF0149 family)
MGIHTNQQSLTMSSHNSEINFDQENVNENLTKSEIKKKEMRQKATQSLNSNCFCGSGKKYKNCCLKKTL